VYLDISVTFHYSFETNSLRQNPVPVYQAPLEHHTQQVEPIILEHKNLDELNAMDPFDFPVSFIILLTTACIALLEIDNRHIISYF